MYVKHILLFETINLPDTRRNNIEDFRKQDSR